jgi:phosphoribosylamine-glycine ligase
MAKTPFMFWSEDGSTLPLALKLKREGHPILFYVHALEARDGGRGLVPKTTTPEPPKGSVVIFDCVGHGAETAGAVLRKRGFAVIGGNPFSHDLEADRPEGSRIMKQAGISTPETHPFRSIPTAIRWLETQDGPWFVKVSGDSVESSTCEAPDPETMIRYLTWVESRGKVQPFEIQRAITGTEVSCNGWFDGEKFVPPFDITLETKYLMAGDVGPRTGCESNVVYHAQDDALASLTVLRIEDRLRREGYVGPVDQNSLVDGDGDPVGLEWTARLGFDATQAWMRLFGGTLGEQLDAFAHGRLTKWEPARHDLSGTLRLSIPPYPTWEPKLIVKQKGLPLDRRVITDHAIDPVDVMTTPEGPTCAGGSGIVGTIGATGEQIDALGDALLGVAATLSIPTLQYRHDPLAGVAERMAALKKLKLAGYEG